MYVRTTAQTGTNYCDRFGGNRTQTGGNLMLVTSPYKQTFYISETQRAQTKISTTQVETQFRPVWLKS